MFRKLFRSLLILLIASTAVAEQKPKRINSLAVMKELTFKDKKAAGTTTIAHLDDSSKKLGTLQPFWRTLPITHLHIRYLKGLDLKGPPPFMLKTP